MGLVFKCPSSRILRLANALTNQKCPQRILPTLTLWRPRNLRYQVLCSPQRSRPEAKNLTRTQSTHPRIEGQPAARPRESGGQVAGLQQVLEAGLVQDGNAERFGLGDLRRTG